MNNRPRPAFAFFVSFVTFVVVIVSAQAQSPPLTGTASLAGIVVTDEANSTAVRRATVTLYVPGDSRRTWVTSTDDGGAFLFDRLPAANVTVFASKAGYVRVYYGAKRPGSTLAVPIALADGQRAPAITLRMLRGAAITGTVTDPSGKPMQAVPVRVRLLTVMPSGERTLTNVPLGTIGSAGTDDRGIYRIFGLPPGDYVVSAQPVGRDFFYFNLNQAQGDLRQTTAAELRWAERAISGGGGVAPGTDVVPPAPGRGVAYATVYHPGTAELSGAAPVTVAAGQERSSIDLPMQFVPTARIEGSLVDANGQPAPGVMVTLSPRGNFADEAQRLIQLEVGLLAEPSGRTGPDGTFAITATPPGQYSLWVRTVSRAGAAAPVWAMVDVDVNGRDVQGLSLRLAPGMSVSGRMELDTAAAGGASPPRVTVRLVPVAAGISTATLVTLALAGSDFAIPGLMPGRYRLVVAVPGPNATTPSAWIVKSAMAGNRDVADGIVDIRPGGDVSGVVVTLSDRAAGVSGIVYDTAGRATSDLSLVLFPVDRAQWFAGSRRLRAPVRAASDGRFAFTGLPAGEYFLAALNDFDPATWSTPEFLEQVASAAIKMTLGEGEKKTQDLRLAR